MRSLLIGSVLFSVAGLARADAAPDLARETVRLLTSLDGQLIAAVRQRDTRGGRDDFARFIARPIQGMRDRWSVLPQPARVEWYACIAALQGFDSFAADSFKAGVIGAVPADLRQSRAACAKLARGR